VIAGDLPRQLVLIEAPVSSPWSVEPGMVVRPLVRLLGILRGETEVGVPPVPRRKTSPLDEGGDPSASTSGGTTPSELNAVTRPRAPFPKSGRRARARDAGVRDHDIIVHGSADSDEVLPVDRPKTARGALGGDSSRNRKRTTDHEPHPEFAEARIQTRLHRRHPTVSPTFGLQGQHPGPHFNPAVVIPRNECRVGGRPSAGPIPSPSLATRRIEADPKPTGLPESDESKSARQPPPCAQFEAVVHKVWPDGSWVRGDFNPYLITGANIGPWSNSWSIDSLRWCPMRPERPGKLTHSRVDPT